MVLLLPYSKGYQPEMKRKFENSDVNVANKLKKMDENTPIDVDNNQQDNSDKIKYVDNKNGLDRTTIQKSHVVRKLVIKNFGNTLNGLIFFI